MIQASSSVPVAVLMQRDIQFVARQTVSPEAQDNQPQIVMPLDSRETDDPPPSYEDVASGYQTMLFDLSRSYSSVTMQAGNGIVEFQTVTSVAHEKQSQIVELPNSSSAVENPPPPYEAFALGYQTVQFNLPPSQYKQSIASMNFKLSLQRHRATKQFSFLVL